MFEQAELRGTPTGPNGPPNANAKATAQIGPGGMQFYESSRDLRAGGSDEAAVAGDDRDGLARLVHRHARDAQER